MASVDLAVDVATINLAWLVVWLQQTCCNLISLVSRHAANIGRMFSPVGCNVMFCCERYQQVVTVDNIFNCSPSQNCNYCISQVSDDLRTTVLRLLELIMARDNVMFLSHSEFHKSDFYYLINLICTS